MWLHTWIVMGRNLCPTVALTCLMVALCVDAESRHTSAALLPAPIFFTVPCSATTPEVLGEGFLPGCTPDVEALLSMVERGFAFSTVRGGPSILDVNGGLLRDAHGMLDIYGGRSKREKGAPPLSRRKTPLGKRRMHASPAAVTPAGAPKVKFTPVVFSQPEYALYKSVFDRIHQRLMTVFRLKSLWFTAPTFVARILGDSGPEFQPEGDTGLHGGGASVWTPSSPHDEYWHPHSDQANTAHYHWSGLLYLSTQGVGDSTTQQEVDFSGGRFAFLRHENGTAGEHLTSDLGPDEQWIDEHSVEPRAGRLLLFSSGAENVHAVRRVSSGVRYVFSMWFTCEPSAEFDTFLDGKLHTHFAKRERPSTTNSDSEAQHSEL